jgi:hypothetical protein
MAKLLSGTEAAAEIRADLKAQVAELTARSNGKFRPGLTIVQVTFQRPVSLCMSLIICMCFLKGSCILLLPKFGDFDYLPTKILAIFVKSNDKS